MEEVGELYEKKVECKVCGREFKTNKVRISKMRLVKRDSDFLNYYEGENPVKYSVFVCPHCGYAAMESKFNNINFAGREIIKKEITPKWNKRKFNGKRDIGTSIEAYKLALYNGELLDYDKLDLGNICIRIGWLYRIKGEEYHDEEIRFISYARDLYKEAYYKEYLENSSMDEVTLAYLVGELSRRLGENENALNWFNTVLTNPDIKDNSMLEKMAREQWIIAKEN